MDPLREVTRLNLALEFVSDCAGLTSTDAAVDLVGQKLRWIVDFDACALVLRADGAERWWAMASGQEALVATADDPAQAINALLRQSMSSRMPSVSGAPMQATAIAHPLGLADTPLGALGIRRAAGLSHRDFRFLHHIATALGSALQRVHQSERLISSMTQASAKDRAARDKARADNDAKDAFVAMLAHELRNPLAPIMSAVEVLRHDTTDKSREVIDIVDRQARQLKRLVDDLMDTSRLSTGKVNLQRRLMDLRAVTSDAAEAVKHRLAKYQQSLDIDLPQAAVTVNGDSARLTQVVTNLLVNASKFSPSGSRIALRVHSASEAAVLEVEDDGIGIEPQMLGKIFHMFVQGRRSDACSPEGLGLGLGVARALIELHGGTIEAVSDGPNLGSTFRVTLPMVTAGATQQTDIERARGGRAPDRRVAPRRILLVDDNADAASATGELLSSAGHDVAVVNNPADALTRAITFRPEVAILDLGLPIMDGYALATALRQQLGMDAPKFVALSGYGQEKDRRRSDECGFSVHLVKPAGITELLESVDAAWDTGRR